MPDKQKDVIIKQAALKATNECKPVHLTVWYVPHPLKLVTFSCGGLDAFFQSSKKIKDKKLLYFACPGPKLVCLSDLFTRLLAWTLLQVSLQSYLQSKKMYLSWMMTGQHPFLGSMFLYTGEQQK